MLSTGKNKILQPCCQALCLLLLFVPIVTFSQSKAATSQKDIAKKEREEQSYEEGLIRLESIFVGDKEQPSVSYFIPWKGTDSADSLRWQLERKNDDTLSLVDRDILLRSVNIYNEMNLE